MASLPSKSFNSVIVSFFSRRSTYRDELNCDEAMAFYAHAHRHASRTCFLCQRPSNEVNATAFTIVRGYQHI